MSDAFVDGYSEVQGLIYRIARGKLEVHDITVCRRRWVDGKVSLADNPLVSPSLAEGPAVEYGGPLRNLDTDESRLQNKRGQQQECAECHACHCSQLRLPEISN